MPETASSKTVTETVQAVSKNTVKITLDEYNELVRKAARPIVNNVTVIRKTAEQAARDNEFFGGFLAVLGTTVAVGGFLLRRHGKKHLV